MPDSHSQNRTKECLVCFKSIASKKCRLIRGDLEKRVKENFLASFDPENEIYPNAICDSHRIMIGKNPDQLPTPVDFAQLASPTKSDPYLCEMCKLTRQNVVLEKVLCCISKCLHQNCGRVSVMADGGVVQAFIQLATDFQKVRISISINDDILT